MFLANCSCVPYYYPGKTKRNLLLSYRKKHHILLITVPSYLPVCSISAYTCIENAIGIYIFKKLVSLNYVEKRPALKGTQRERRTGFSLLPEKILLIFII